MLSSRSHHNLFVDKENGANPAASSSLLSRKPVSSSHQPAGGMAFKTPGGIKQQSQMQHGAKTGMKPQLQTGGKGLKPGSQTVALEPGARVLGAKDANNRQTVMRLNNNKGKGKESAECSEMEPKVLFKDVSATKESGTTNVTRPSKQLSETPAKNASSKPSSGNPNAFKTPSLTARKVARTPRPPAALPSQSFSIFKTPSPGLLNRKRKEGATPPHIQFDGFVKPAGLRDDNDLVQEQEEMEVEPPTLLDLLQADLDKIDEEQEVEYAGSSAFNYEEAYEPDFDMPVYSDLRISETCFFPGYAQCSAADLPDDDDFLPTVAMLEPETAGQLPKTKLSDIEPPLFPELSAKSKQSALVSKSSKSSLVPPRKVQLAGQTPPGTPKTAARTITRAPLSSRPTSRSVSSLISSTSTARPSSTAPVSRIHSRTGSVASSSRGARTSSLRGVQPQRIAVHVEGLEGREQPDTELNLTLD